MATDGIHAASKKQDFDTPPLAALQLRDQFGRTFEKGASMFCHHEARLDVERWPDHAMVSMFGPRMVCTRCGIVAPAPGRIGESRRRGRASAAGHATPA